MSQPYGGNNYPYYPPQRPQQPQGPRPGGPPAGNPYHLPPQQRPPQGRPPQQRPPQQRPPQQRPPQGPPRQPPPQEPKPPKPPFPWATFWTAIGSIGAVLAVLVTLLVQNAGSGGGTTQVTPTASPTPTQSATPTPSSTVNEEARLRRAVPTTVLDNCTTDSEALKNTTIVAALDCYTTGGDLPRPLLVVRYADANALNAAVNGESNGLVSQENGCRKGEAYVDNWGSANSSETKGRLVCRTKGSRYRIMWTFDDNNVLFIAEDSSHSRVYGWWRNHANGVLNEQSG